MSPFTRFSSNLLLLLNSLPPPPRSGSRFWCRYLSPYPPPPVVRFPSVFNESLINFQVLCVSCSVSPSINIMATNTHLMLEQRSYSHPLTYQLTANYGKFRFCVKLYNRCCFLEGVSLEICACQRLQGTCGHFGDVIFQLQRHRRVNVCTVSLQIKFKKSLRRQSKFTSS